MLTGSRVALGAAATVAALDGRFHTAAALITLGAATDILDGLLARRLGVASAFGALFDTFSDYLCFVVAPWTLTRAGRKARLLAGQSGFSGDARKFIDAPGACQRLSRGGIA